MLAKRSYALSVNRPKPFILRQESWPRYNTVYSSKTTSTQTLDSSTISLAGGNLGVGELVGDNTRVVSGIHLTTHATRERGGGGNLDYLSKSTFKEKKLTLFG